MRRAPLAMLHRRLAAGILTLVLAGVASLASPPDGASPRGRRSNRNRQPKITNSTDLTVNPQYKKTDVATLIEIRTREELKEKRSALVELAFGQPEIPASILPVLEEKGVRYRAWTDTKAVSRIDSLRYTMNHGIDSFMYYFHASKPGGRVALYQEGHGEGFESRPEIIQALLEAGCDVIAMSMPLMGRNSRPLVQIDHIGLVLMDTHFWLGYLDRPMGYFMEPIAAAVNYARKERPGDEIIMVGFSGGGWATTLYAAMDPRIIRSYPVAGTIPMYLRSSVPDEKEPDAGDFEQVWPGLLRVANYLEMYVMGSSGEGRRQLQVINQFDTSVPIKGVKFQTYLPVVRAAVARLGPGQFDVFLDTTLTFVHTIKQPTIDRIVRDLAAPR